MHWDLALSIALTLLIILDPFGNAPLVHSLLHGIEPRRKRLIMARETLFITLILLFFYAAGGAVLRYFGISDAALTITGGILLMLIAVGLVFPRINVLEESKSNEGETNASPIRAREPFLVPITVPLVVGPASMAYVMLQASLSQRAEDCVCAVSAIIAACVTTGTLLALASDLIARIGRLFAVILERVMGTLLTMIAMEMLLNGISMYLHSLA